MRLVDIQKHKGEVVLLDLVTGMQICTEIKAINYTTDQIECGKVIVFQIVQEPKDPEHPPHPQMNPIIQTIKAQPFGGPFTLPRNEDKFDIAHILMAYTPIDAIEKAYLQAVSGIEVVGAGAVQNIKGGPSGIVR
jgi:hypothetical protein